MVVFQYGSAVLFNIADHEAEHYLDIIRKHASGWLPEMRKDGITHAIHYLACHILPCEQRHFTRYF